LDIVGKRLGFIVLLAWSIGTIYRFWGTWSIDASAVYFGAYFYDLGQFGLVYSPDPVFFSKNVPTEWSDLAELQGAISDGYSPYVYPPLWAALLAPIASKLTAISFFNMLNLLNVLATVLSIYLAYWLYRPQKIGFFVWSLISVAFLQLTMVGRTAIEFGQPQIFVTFLILASFWALMSGRNRLAGAVLALAAAIKIAPGYLVIIFIMERRWRALGWFVAVGAGLAGASFLVSGADLHKEFLLRLQDLDGKVLIARINLTLDSVLLQLVNWFENAPGWRFFHYWIQEKPNWIFWVNKLALVIGLWVSYHVTRGVPTGRRICFRLQLVFLVTLITSPLAWVHYLYLTILLLPGLLEVTAMRIAAPFLAVFLILFSTEVYLQLYSSLLGGNFQLFSEFTMVLLLVLIIMLSAGRKIDNQPLA